MNKLETTQFTGNYSYINKKDNRFVFNNTSNHTVIKSEALPNVFGCIKQKSANCTFHTKHCISRGLDMLSIIFRFPSLFAFFKVVFVLKNFIYRCLHLPLFLADHEHINVAALKHL